MLPLCFILFVPLFNNVFNVKKSLNEETLYDIEAETADRNCEQNEIGETE
jgi:hypothetical protein